MHVEWIFWLMDTHDTAPPERVAAYNRLAAASHEKRWGCSVPLRLTTSVPLSHFLDDDDG